MSALIWIVAFFLVIWLFTKSLFYGVIAAIIYLIVFFKKKSADVCIVMAYRKYAEGEIIKAFEWFEKAFKKGMNLKQKVTYSYYLLREGKTERAEEILNGVLGFKLEPADKYLAKSHHALVLMKTGREKEAQEELLEIFPNYKNTTTYGSLGYLYVLNESFQKALEFNKEAYDYNSDDPVIIDNLVEVYLKNHDFENAFIYAEKLISKEPKFIEAYYDAAKSAIGVKKYDLAREYLEKALEIKTTFLSNVSHEDVKKLMEEIPA